MRNFFLTALLSLCWWAAGSAATPKFFGYMMSSDDYAANAGIYSFTVDDAGRVAVAPECVPEGMFNYDMMFTARGGVWADGAYWLVNSDRSTLERYDATGWTMTSVGVDNTSFATDLALNPIDSKVYGCFMKPGAVPYDMKCTFGTLDLTNGRMTPVADIDGYWLGLAFTIDGSLFAVDGKGALLKVDPATGSTTPVGSTGVTTDEIFRPSPMVCDMATGTLYWINRTVESSTLYTVATSDGRATKVAKFPKYEYFMSIALPAAATSAEAPAKIADLSARFAPDGTGTVAFTMPVVDVRGNAVTASAVGYDIAVGGVSAAKGSAAPGAAVSCRVSTAARGVTVLTVTLSVGSAESTTSADIFIGADAPLAPGAPTLRRGNGAGSAVVSWTAPTAGVHGSAISAADLTYRVVRRPEGKVVADGLKATTFTDAVTADAPRAVAYDIIAIAAGQESAPASTSALVLGPGFRAPYAQDFATDDCLDLLTIDDANADGVTWGLYANCSDRYALVGYNPELPKDDWLVLPPVAMSAGKIYTLQFSAKANFITRPERMEVMMGLKPEPAAMTATLMAARQLECRTSGEWADYTMTFTVDSDADRWIGFHAISEPDRSYIGLRSIRLFENESGAPLTVTEVRATPAPFGAHSAKLSFRTPEKCVDGSTLASIKAVNIMLNGRQAATVSNPAPGTTVEVELTGTREGTNNVTIVCVSDAGESKPVETTVYTGLDSPGLVRNPRAVRSEGGVTVSWDEPEGANGGYVLPDSTQYIIARYIGSDYDLLGPVKGQTAFTDAFEAEEQTILTYMIFASNNLGTGRGNAAPSVIVGGEPITLPWHESYEGGFSLNLCGVASVGGGLGTWSLWSEEHHTSVAPADNDKGALAFTPEKPGDMSRIFYGNMTLEGTTDPTVEFQWFNNPRSAARLHVEAMGDDGVWQRLATFAMDASAPRGWRKAAVALKPVMANKLVNISFVGEAADDLEPLFVDDITVRDIVDIDLAAYMDCRRRFDLGKDQKLTTTVTNLGRRTVADWHVDYFCGDRLVATASAPKALAPDESLTFDAIVVADRSFPASALYRAVVVADGDLLPANNSSAPVSVTHVFPKYPAPELSGSTAADGAVSLEWTLSGLAESTRPAVVTDDFESYEPFLISDIGEWTMTDGSPDSGTFGLIGFHFPWREAPKSFQVFSLAALGVTMADDEKTWRTVSGDQMLVAFAETDGQNDDWMISPELSGEAQTISFYAKSATYIYGLETYAVMASSTGTALEDFVAVDLGTLEPEWTRIEVALPEGTRRFAIRCTSKHVFAMCVDDVTYTAAPASPADIALKGYNVYVDRSLTPVNNSPVAATSFTSAPLPEGTELAVSAVYNCGESARSTFIAGTQSAIAGTDADRAGVTIRTIEGAVVVEGAEGLPVSVFSADGRLLRSLTGSGVTTIPTAPGVRIVRAGSAAAKVVVR